MPSLNQSKPSLLQMTGRVAQVVQRPRSGGFTSASAEPEQHPVEQGKFFARYRYSHHDLIISYNLSGNATS